MSPPRRHPPAPPEKIDIPPPPLTPPPEPDMQDSSPRRTPPIPDFKIPRKSRRWKSRRWRPRSSSEDFTDLLNKLTTPDKPAKTAKAGPRIVQAVGLGNAMAATDLADMLRSQIRPLLEPNRPARPTRPIMIVNFDLRAQSGRDRRQHGADAEVTTNGRETANPYTRRRR